MTTPKQSNAIILAALPAGTHRVKVQDELGKTRYKPLADVTDLDVILRNSSGEPITMANGPGRPKAATLAPSTNPRVVENLKAKERFVEQDDLLETIRIKPESGDVLDYVMEGLAAEAASLGFERLYAENNGEPTSQISMRRINALKAVGDSWLKRKEQVSGSIDLDSPALKRLFGLIMETFKESLEDMHMRSEMVETVFVSLAKKLDSKEWKMQAEKVLEND